MDTAKRLYIYGIKEHNMDVIRKIYANKIEDIDIQNIGCHWTSDESVLTRSGAFGYTSAEGSIEYRVYATVEESYIDQLATDFSNDRYPSEKEVVLLKNVKLSVTIWNREIGEDEYIGEANTGTRNEKWVDNFHNGVTD